MRVLGIRNIWKKRKKIDEEMTKSIEKKRKIELLRELTAKKRRLIEEAHLIKDQLKVL